MIPNGQLIRRRRASVHIFDCRVHWQIQSSNCDLSNAFETGLPLGADDKGR